MLLLSLKSVAVIRVFFPKTGILAYFVLIIMLIVLYTFILTLKNMFIFLQIDLSYEKVIHV